MTCIVGIIDKENDKVLIGGDSVGYKDNHLASRKDQKVFRVGEFVIGFTSSYRMANLLQYSFKPPKIKTKNIHKYMCTDFVNALKECFRDGGYIGVYDSGGERGGTFLVGYKNRLFKIEEDFQVGERSDGFDSCGCGEDYAVASMYNTEGQHIKNRIIKALETAEYFSDGVRGPFKILSTK